MKYNINSDIPLPESVLRSHKKQIRLWYEHHQRENIIPPYQFYHEGHLISLAFESTSGDEPLDPYELMSVIVSSIILVLCLGILILW